MHFIKTALFSVIFSISSCFFCSQANAQDNGSFKIIVNKSNPVSKMTKQQLSRLFLKKNTKWNDGKKTFPVNLIETSPIRKIFSKAIHGREIYAIKAYWQKQIFSGRGVPPPEKSSDNEILEYVQTHAGAIGYVSTKANVTKVKVVKIKTR